MNSKSTFFSRKNKVTLVREDGCSYVLKEFIIGDPEIEWEMLTQCRKREINVPRPISIDGRTITMEYVKGDTFADRLLLTHAQCNMLSRWLFSFHDAFPGIKRGDSMLRNFIEHDSKAYGIDFEESCKGDGIEDVALLCSSILTENPIFTQTKLQEARWVASRYFELSGRHDYNTFSNSLEKELLFIAARRKDGSDILGCMPLGKTVIL